MTAEHAVCSAAAAAGPWLSSALSGPATVRSRMRTRDTGRLLPGNGRKCRLSLRLTELPPTAPPRSVSSDQFHLDQFHLGRHIRPPDLGPDLPVPSSPDTRPRSPESGSSWKGRS